MSYTLIGTIRQARVRVEARKLQRAQALVDAALHRIDHALGAGHERGRPKPTLRLVRGQIAEAGFAVVESDFSRAAAMLDKAIRELENPSKNELRQVGLRRWITLS